MARGENTANHPNRKVGRGDKRMQAMKVQDPASEGIYPHIDPKTGERVMSAYEKHEKENPELMADMDGGLDAHFPESAKLNPKGSY
jgi:hypothetical protein